MNEAETRAEHIDPALQAAGWGVVEGSRMLGELPQLFRDESELRAIWSLPDTRAKLLEALAEKRFGLEQLTENHKRSRGSAGTSSTSFTKGRRE